MSLILRGMISAVGVRDVVENKVDFTHTRGVIIAALILVPVVGVNCAGSIRLGHAKNTPDFRPRCFLIESITAASGR